MGMVCHHPPFAILCGVQYDAPFPTQNYQFVINVYIRAALSQLQNFKKQVLICFLNKHPLFTFSTPCNVIFVFIPIPKDSFEYYEPGGLWASPSGQRVAGRPSVTASVTEGGCNCSLTKFSYSLLSSSSSWSSWPVA